ncbi:MAG: FAD-binding protein [Myxococcales bacterium]|nr:FAD-binding protein [Myxococcales bacterium]
MFDIAIIGAGPAGSTVSRLLGRDRRILLLERRAMQSEQTRQDKCCGGLLAPDAQQALATLRLGIPRQVLCGPQLFAVCALDLDSGQERFYQRFYINTDRLEFDRYLLSLVPSSVDYREGIRCREIAREAAGFRLRLSSVDGKRAWNERARIVIGCDGAGSVVRRTLFSSVPRPRSYTAVQEWFETKSESSPYYGAIFSQQTTDFYGWTIPKERQLIIGAALTPGDRVMERFRSLVDRLRARGLRLGRMVRRHAAPVLRPGSLREICLGGDGAALVGEAAGFISPSSAEGVSFALLSARALAQAMTAGERGWLERYRVLTLTLRLKIVLKGLKAPVIYHPLLRSLIMRSGLSSLPISE